MPATTLRPRRSVTRRVLVAILSALVAGATVLPGALPIATAGSAGTLAAATTSASSALTPAEGRLFGAFVDPAGSPTNPSDGDSQAAVDAFERRIGRSLDLRRVFLRWDDPIGSATVRADVANGRTPVLSVRPQRRDGSLITWSQVASGAVDADIAEQAQAVRGLGVPVFLSFHHEPDMEKSFGTPAEYVAAWRHYVRTMRSAGVTNAAYTWIMTPASFGSAYVGAGADAYYPGDDVVDWAGLDAYNWLGCSPGKPTSWRSLATVVSPFRNFGVKIGKPLMLAEWGSVEDPADPGRKAAWLREGMAALDAMPEFKAISYFDTHGTCPWWTDSSQQTLDAFREIASDASAYGRTSGSLLADSAGGPAPLSVTFDASASAGAGYPAGQGVSRWQIDLGDGSPLVEGTGTPPAALKHTFAAGTHVVRLDVTDATGSTATRSRVVAAAPPPTVTADAQATGDTGAVLKAWVNTQNLEGTATFEWGKTTEYGFARTVDAAPLGWSQTLTTELTDLEPGTRYHWRVVARTAAGTTRLEGRHVDTTGPPTVHVDAPSDVTATSATLNARLHPHSLDSTLMFELVPSGGGSTVRTSTVSVAAHTGYRWLKVPVTGLKAATTYQVTAVAANASGTTTAARSVATAASTGDTDDQVTQTAPDVDPPTVSADGRDATDTSLTVISWVNTGGLTGSLNVEWGTTTEYGSARTVELPASTSGQTVNVPLEQLTPATRYHWRVTVVTDAGSAVVAGRYTDTTGAPTVLVDEPADVTASSATLKSRLHPHSLDSTLTFRLVPVDGGTTVTSAPLAVAAHTGFRWLDVPVTGLTAGTAYEVTAVAANASGTSEASRSLSTLAGTGDTSDEVVQTAPDVEPPTLAADGRDATDTSLTVIGWVNTRGLTGKVTVEWGTTTSYGSSRVVELPASTSGQTVDVALEELTTATRYHWQVTAVTDAGDTVVTGRFTDTTGAPTVHVDDAADVTASSATLKARLHPHSLDSSLTFELVPADGGPTLLTPAVPVAAHTGYRWLDVVVTGLRAGTDYEVTAVASNASGTTTDVRSMTTSGSDDTTPPPVLDPSGEPLIVLVCVEADPVV